MAGRFFRALVWLHRYMGIAVGLLMMLWCLSGAVMMYVPYPQLDETTRQQRLEPLEWRDCCQVGPGWEGLGPLSQLQVEALGGRPVLRVREAAGASQLIDLWTGHALSRVVEAQAARVATGFLRPGSPPPHLLDRIRVDQWTVQGARGPDRPLWHFSLNDALGTEVYVSSVTGKAIQLTTASQRFWNWLGSVPHWLYFTRLREDGGLWSQVVVWTSLIGCFLTVTGLYLGVVQLKAGGGRLIPYRGWHYWHHLSGLLFGVMTLTWVASGLISMNPWGFLEGTGFSEPASLRGTPIAADRALVSLRSVAGNNTSRAFVALDAAPLGGQLYWVATAADGSRLRLDAEGRPAPLAVKDLEYIAATLDPQGGQGALPVRLQDEDTYYFSHHRQHVILPVYRLISTDPQQTRYYIDVVDGQLITKVDGDGRWYRWLHQGLHRVDFTPALRAHPLWDLLTLLLLAGVSVVCGIGAYLGVRRLSRGSG